jgi:hypothetical protein
MLNSERTNGHIIYSNIRQNLNLLTSYTFMESVKTKDDEQPQYLKNIRTVLGELKGLLSGEQEEDNCMYTQAEESLKQEEEPILKLRDSSVFCRIFKSLDAGELMVNVLRSLMNIPVRFYHDYIDTIQVCLELLCIVSRNDKEFQVGSYFYILFPLSEDVYLKLPYRATLFLKTWIF